MKSLSFSGNRWTGVLLAALFTMLVVLPTQKTFGQEREVNSADADNDGIPDKEDACPLAKGNKSPNPSTNGCPTEEPAKKPATKEMSVEDQLRTILAAAPNDFRDIRNEGSLRVEKDGNQIWHGLINLPGNAIKPTVSIGKEGTFYKISVVPPGDSKATYEKMEEFKKIARSAMGPDAVIGEENEGYFGFSVPIKDPNKAAYIELLNWESDGLDLVIYKR